MICSVVVLLMALLSLDWAKTCKPVNFKYKRYGGVQEYGYGCKKGCFGYQNTSALGPEFEDDGSKRVDDHYEQDKCLECKTITPGWYKDEYVGWTGMSDDDAKKGAKAKCNEGLPKCYWRKDKCVAGSCLVTSIYSKCDEDYGHERKDGICKKVKGDKCKAKGYRSQIYPASFTGSSPSDGELVDVLCKDLKGKYGGTQCMSGTCVGYDEFTDDDVKKCKYYCEHPGWEYYAGGPWDYTRSGRKECHKLYGCMFSGGNSTCSAFAIWAFVLILVLAILIFVAIIVVVVIIILKLCGGKSTKVSPEAAAAESKSAAGPAAAPASQDPPPQTGPYVVIRLGKQSLETKKVESSVWGQSIVFTGLGAEDDDVVFELHDNSGAVLGTTDVRIPEYVNAKKRASITLKNGEVSIGVLEVDIEIQVQEEPEVKITGVFYVDRFSKA